MDLGGTLASGQRAGGHGSQDHKHREMRRVLVIL